MSLIHGTGPLAPRAAGRFNVALPETDHLMYFEPSPWRVRAILAGEAVVDCRRTMQLHESGVLPVWWFPREDVLVETAESELVDAAAGRVRFSDVRAGGRVAAGALREVVEPAPGAEFLEGYAMLDWDVMDEWFVEDEQIHGHLKDPYTRVDVVRTTRHLRVEIEGETVADTRRAKMLAETSLPVRWYVPAGDVRTELLEPSSQRSRCAYKGSASYWHVRVGDKLVEDVVWAYPEPQHDADQVRDHFCFFNEQVDIIVDGERADRPQTQWSRSADTPPGGQALRGLMGRR